MIIYVWSSDYWVRPTENDYQYRVIFEPDPPFEFPKIYGVAVNDHKMKLVITAKHRFRIDYKSDEAEWVNLSGTEHYGKFNDETGLYHHEWGETELKSEWKVRFRMTYFSEDRFHKNSVFFYQNKLCNYLPELIHDLSEVFHTDVFSKVETDDSNSYLKLTVRNGIRKLKFLDQLSICLGFSKRYFEFPSYGENYYDDEFVPRQTRSNTIQGTFSPIFSIGINHLYIYTSISNPINVGGTLLPLLKSIWLDGEKREYGHGDIINIPISNPMYLPVSSTSINTIEINIRNDYGKFIPFPEGSVTSLTLHFKREGRSRERGDD